MASPVIRSEEDEAKFQLLRRQVLQWKAGMEQANQFTLEEARRRTPAERYQNLQRFLIGEASYGLARQRPEDRVHRTPYHEVQERWLARHPEHLIGN